jgi:hypothetical protein
MSKKVVFPVMSQMITGVLYVVGILLLTLRYFVGALSIDLATLIMLDGLVGFLAMFLIVWALTSFCLHPGIEEKTKLLFIALTLIIIASVFTQTFASTIKVGKL